MKLIKIILLLFLLNSCYENNLPKVKEIVKSKTENDNIILSLELNSKLNDFIYETKRIPNSLERKPIYNFIFYKKNNDIFLNLISSCFTFGTEESLIKIAVGYSDSIPIAIYDDSINGYGSEHYIVKSVDSILLNFYDLRYLDGILFHEKKMPIWRYKLFNGKYEISEKFTLN